VKRQAKKMMKNKKSKKNKGQVMILAIIMVSGAILTTSSILGLLMVYQLRGANDAVSSVKAIFAADTGIEWESYKLFVNNISKPTLEPGTTFTTTIRETTSTYIIDSTGVSGRSFRALQTVFYFL